MDSSWLELLALGSWLLLCGLDFIAVPVSGFDETLSQRWWSHGLELCVLVAGFLAFLIGQCGLFSSAKERPGPTMAVSVPYMPSDKVRDLHAPIVHGILVAGGTCWLVLQAVLHREPQVWMGASTLYTLAALAVAHRVSSVPPRGLPLSAPGPDKGGAVYAWGRHIKQEAVHHHAAGEQSMGTKRHATPWFKRSITRGVTSNLSDAAESVNHNSIVLKNRNSTGRWTPLFKDPTFGEVQGRMKRAMSTTALSEGPVSVLIAEPTAEHQHQNQPARPMPRYSKSVPLESFRIKATPNTPSTFPVAQLWEPEQERPTPGEDVSMLGCEEAAVPVHQTRSVVSSALSDVSGATNSLMQQMCTGETNSLMQQMCSFTEEGPHGTGEAEVEASPSTRSRDRADSGLSSALTDISRPSPAGGSDLGT